MIVTLFGAINALNYVKSDKPISNSSNLWGQGFQPITNKGENTVKGRNIHLQVSVMQIFQKRVKKSKPAALQCGRTEKRFSEGEKTLLSIALQGRLALIFILFLTVPISTGNTSQQAWNYYIPKLCIASDRDMHQKPTFVVKLWIFQNQKALFFHFRKKNHADDWGNNIQSSNSTGKKREWLVWQIKSTRASVYPETLTGAFSPRWP